MRQVREKFEYFEVMGGMGLAQISLVHALILLTGFAGLNLRKWIENGHVGQFSELGRAHESFDSSPNVSISPSVCYP
ncbi:hypothetical protein H5410_014930 [Solanum commersonii]|uniref:Uncharacterized protein n=1 Tax=Solanum commersonii TaxID=4109 RepID=A0A9J5ZSV0_SOLCO|nr:hypothetical protein H5410_014930 [Solanum commersonii]